MKRLNLCISWVVRALTKKTGVLLFSSSVTTLVVINNYISNRDKP